MNYHKLLSRQISKFLPESFTDNPEMQKFLSAINDSYIAADKDKELAERAFSISEEEYREVNQQLAKEVEVRKQSIEKLKETVGKITGEEKKENTDDLLMIARYLLQQVNKRKNAELVFTSLIANLKNAVLLEDENRKLVFVNSHFCNLFDIQGAPETLQGMNCNQVFQANKNKFKSPDQFIQSITALLEKKEVCNNDILECADGRVFERDYIPIVHDGKYKGHLWSYTDITEKKIKEEAYKRISLVASANHSGVLFTDATGKINWCNEGFSKLTGFSRIETIGRTPIELCRGPLTDQGSLEKIMEEFFKGNPFHIDVIYYRKDGTWFWGRSYTQPVKDDNGNVTEYFGIIDDITEEKEMENRFRLALNKIGDNLWEHNYLTGETKFSDEKHQLLGYDQHDFNTNKDLWWKNIYPGDLPLLQQNHKDYISGEKSHHTLEYRMVHKSGELRWVLDKGVVIEKDVNNKPVRIIGTHTDITAIKETEKALRENQELFRSLEENIPGILYKYEFSPAGQESFIYISPDAEKKIGFTEEDLQNFYNLLHPDDVAREKAASDRARKINGPYHFEGRFAAEGKPVQWLHLSSSFSHMAENGSRVYTGIILNTTKEKEAELVIQLNEKKYRNIIENMNLGLLEVDTQEIIQYANQSFCDMSGYTQEELIGNNASNLFVRDENIQLLEIKNDNRKKSVSDVYEIAVKNKEGKTKWWL
ncbi:MAG: PAS domain S-box protein, partial [Bacteroidetes bacterium]|nr:PAS domain S-box protein [Bacteroidota bacterium]